MVCYLHPDDRARVPFGDRIPFVSATPETVESVLADLLSDAERRRELSRACRAFVEDVHDPLKIAEMMIDCYRGQAPCAG